MRKLGFKKPKKTPLARALGMPKMPKGPEGVKMKAPTPPKPAPFGRMKKDRGSFGTPF